MELTDTDQAHLLIEVDGNDMDLLMKDAEKIYTCVGFPRNLLGSHTFLYLPQQASKTERCLQSWASAYILPA